MELVEGTVHVGTDAAPEEGERFPEVDAFVAALDRVEREHGVTVQAFDARYVVSRRHLERALALADRERGRDAGIARDRAVEILLYAAGRRQIDRALGMGVGAGTTPAVVLVDAGERERAQASSGASTADGDEAAAAAAVRELLVPGETLDGYDADRVREFYGIGERELAATAASLEELVLERVALLVVER